MSPATLKRDLAYLRERLDAPIEYDAVENGYRFEDLVAAMKAHGFGVFDFLRLRYLKNAPGTRFADVAFKRIEY